MRPSFFRSVLLMVASVLVGGLALMFTTVGAEPPSTPSDDSDTEDIDLVLVGTTGTLLDCVRSYEEDEDLKQVVDFFAPWFDPYFDAAIIDRGIDRAFALFGPGEARLNDCVLDLVVSDHGRALGMFGAINISTLLKSGKEVTTGSSHHAFASKGLPGSPLQSSTVESQLRHALQSALHQLLVDALADDLKSRRSQMGLFYDVYTSWKMLAEDRRYTSANHGEIPIPLLTADVRGQDLRCFTPLTMASAPPILHNARIPQVDPAVPVGMLRTQSEWFVGMLAADIARVMLQANVVTGRAMVLDAYGLSADESGNSAVFVEMTDLFLYTDFEVSVSVVARSFVRSECDHVFSGYTPTYDLTPGH